MLTRQEKSLRLKYRTKAAPLPDDKVIRERLAQLTYLLLTDTPAGIEAVRNIFEQSGVEFTEEIERDLSYFPDLISRQSMAQFLRGDNQNALLEGEEFIQAMLPHSRQTLSNRLVSPPAPKPAPAPEPPATEDRQRKLEGFRRRYANEPEPESKSLRLKYQSKALSLSEAQNILTGSSFVNHVLELIRDRDWHGFENAVTDALVKIGMPSGFLQELDHTQHPRSNEQMDYLRSREYADAVAEELMWFMRDVVTNEGVYDYLPLAINEATEEEATPPMTDEEWGMVSYALDDAFRRYVSENVPQYLNVNREADQTYGLDPDYHPQKRDEQRRREREGSEYQAQRQRASNPPSQKPTPSDSIEESDKKSFDAVRRKYRTAKGLRRRVKRSSAGTSILKVRPSDTHKVREMADNMGVSVTWRGQKEGYDVLRLSGDDPNIDKIAVHFGC